MEKLSNESVEVHRVIKMNKAERFDYYHEMAKKVVDELEKSKFVLFQQERNTFLELLKLEFNHRFCNDERNNLEEANKNLKKITEKLLKTF